MDDFRCWQSECVHHGCACQCDLNVSNARSDPNCTHRPPVDRDQNDSLVWRVMKDGVRYSAEQTALVADIVNPIALSNLDARVRNNAIAAQNVLDEFMQLNNVSSSAAILEQYRSALLVTPVTSMLALQTLIDDVTVEAEALLDLTNTPSDQITLAQLRALLPSQYFVDSLLPDYQTALDAAFGQPRRK